MRRLSNRRSFVTVVILGIIVTQGFIAGQTEKERETGQTDKEPENRPRGSSLTVRDARNRLVGPLLAPGSVGLRIDNEWFEARILPDSIRPPGSFGFDAERFDRRHRRRSVPASLGAPVRTICADMRSISAKAAAAVACSPSIVV